MFNVLSTQPQHAGPLTRMQSLTLYVDATRGRRRGWAAGFAWCQIGLSASHARAELAKMCDGAFVVRNGDGPQLPATEGSTSRWVGGCACGRRGLSGSYDRVLFL
jgi:hypothetical protein